VRKKRTHTEVDVLQEVVEPALEDHANSVTDAATLRHTDKSVMKGR
jgi:hypothetical protein